MNEHRWEWMTDGTTFIGPVGLSVTLLMCVFIVVLPRRYAIVPLLALTCFLTMGQRVMILGLNFTMIRLLLVFGWARLILRCELRPIHLNGVDKAVVLWSVVGVLAHTLLFQTSGALVYRLGQAYNAIATYFLFRFLIRKWDDVNLTVRTLALFVIPLAIVMLVEKSTGRNLLSGFGGIPEFTEVRQGVIRAQGPFGHSILAGTFGASLIPIFVGMARQRANRRSLVGLSIAAAIVITFASGSSGPVMALCFGLLALALWPIRAHMRLFRWSVLAAVIGLQVAMKAPVWFLMARVSVFTGSTGFHRAYLIDQAFSNFGDWWLVGIRSTASWGPEMIDLTNQYIREGVQGGLITMVLFIAIIAFAFRSAGQAMWRARLHPELRPLEVQLWGLGAALVVHVFSYISISYFDQNFVTWYLLLAIMGAAPALVTRRLAAVDETASVIESKMAGARIQESSAVALPEAWKQFASTSPAKCQQGRRRRAAG